MIGLLLSFRTARASHCDCPCCHATPLRQSCATAPLLLSPPCPALPPLLRLSWPSCLLPALLCSPVMSHPVMSYPRCCSVLLGAATCAPASPSFCLLSALPCSPIPPRCSLGCSLLCFPRLFCLAPILRQSCLLSALPSTCRSCPFYAFSQSPLPSSLCHVLPATCAPAPPCSQIIPALL